MRKWLVVMAAVTAVVLVLGFAISLGVEQYTSGRHPVPPVAASLAQMVVGGLFTGGGLALVIEAWGRRDGGRKRDKREGDS